MSEQNKYKDCLETMNEEGLKAECMRLYRDKEAMGRKLLTKPIEEIQGWSCPVCEYEWGRFAPECGHCGYRRGLEYQELGPIYIAAPGTPVIVDNGSDGQFKTVIVGHCVIKECLHYIVWLPISIGNTYRVVFGGRLTAL